MTLPIVSAMVASVLLLMQITLMVSVGLHRNRGGISLGYGEDIELQRKIRRHGNLAENAAIFIATLALGEILGLSTNLLTGLGAAFVLGRLFHAFAFSSPSGSYGGAGSGLYLAARGLGAMGTVLPSLMLAGYLLYSVSQLVI